MATDPATPPTFEDIHPATLRPALQNAWRLGRESIPHRSLRDHLHFLRDQVSRMLLKCGNGDDRPLTAKTARLRCLLRALDFAAELESDWTHTVEEPT